MNKKEASKAWHVNVNDVVRICEHMQVDADHIPEDLEPVYVPRREVRTDPHRYYIYVLEVVGNPRLKLEGVDEDIIQSCVTQLSRIGLIVPKKGCAPDSTDHRDYILSADREKFYAFSNSRVKEKIGAL